MSIGLHFFKALALKVLSPSYFLMESIDLTTAKTLDIIPEKSFVSASSLSQSVPSSTTFRARKSAI